MEQSKKGFLPVRHGIHLSKSMGPKTPEEIRQMNTIPYASAIGSLMYAIICTRPDIAYVVNIQVDTNLTQDQNTGQLSRIS